MNKSNKKQKEPKDYLDIDFINKNLDSLIDSMYKFGINTPNRIKHFLAQCYHETGGFKHFTENLNYSAITLCTLFKKHFNEYNVYEYARNPEKIANKIYGGRLGNKDPGDGYKYRGRGLVQITFRSNYSKIAKMIGVDIVNNPDLVSNDPQIAIKSACAFFAWKKLNSYADKDDIGKISSIIQGSNQSTKERIIALNKIKNSPILQKIYAKMENYVKNQNNSSAPNSNNNNKINFPSLLFPLDNRDLYTKKLKETIKNNNREKDENNETKSSSSFSSSSSSSSSSLFDEGDLFDNKTNKRKKKKIKIKNEKEKEKHKEKENGKNNNIKLKEEKEEKKEKKEDKIPNKNISSTSHLFTLDNKDIYVKELKNNLEYDTKLGGIDFSNIDEILKNCRNIKFHGLIDNGNLLLFNKKKFQKSNKHSTYINLEDVAVFLKILYDPTIKNKSISFSLDPFEPTNPTGPYMRKVFYPDKLEKKQILQGTKVGEDMFLADYLLKQMSLGYKNSNTKFDFPYELKAKGLQRVQYSNDDNGKFHRFWVITKKIESIANEKSSQGFFV